MKPPQNLSKYLAKSAKLDADVDDEALVKVRTLKTWMARIISMIPAAGAGIKARASLFGEIWDGGAAAPATHPFQVTNLGSDNFQVEGGTIEGQIIPTQIIAVGSTRPVAILGYPQYALSIFNSEYVNGASVKTGANAPVLTHSTTTLSDKTLVSSAGNEARVLIAYIDTGDVITQRALGNISGAFEDAGGLVGKMDGSYNTNV